jgi:hypothetical protein
MLMCIVSLPLPLASDLVSFNSVYGVSLLTGYHGTPIRAFEGT